LLQVSNEPSEEAIKGTLDYLHEKAKSSTAVTVTEPDAVRPMMEVGRAVGLAGTP
jgi:brefeldin A-inhibited guanine nucleotide-exchange protein